MTFTSQNLNVIVCNSITEDNQLAIQQNGNDIVISDDDWATSWQTPSLYFTLDPEFLGPAWNYSCLSGCLLPKHGSSWRCCWKGPDLRARRTSWRTQWHTQQPFKIRTSRNVSTSWWTTGLSMWNHKSPTLKETRVGTQKLGYLFRGLKLDTFLTNLVPIYLRKSSTL